MSGPPPCPLRWAPPTIPTGRASLPSSPPTPPPLTRRSAPRRQWCAPGSTRHLDRAIPDADGTLATAQRTAEILARHAKSDNTRRAYRAGVRAWCAWCSQHGLTPLPARPADVAAFLAAERYRPDGEKPLATNTLRLRVAAIGYLHYLAGCPSPTATAVVTETFAGLDRLATQAGQGPGRNSPPEIGILREIVAPIGDDLPGLRDRALLLLGFAGAFRRAELARDRRSSDLEAAEHGLRITLPFSKGDRDEQGRAGRHPVRRERTLPGARAAALARRRRHHRGSAVPPHLGDAPAKGRAAGLAADPRGRPGRPIDPGHRRAHRARHAGRPPGSTPRRSAATASSAAR